MAQPVVSPLSQEIYDALLHLARRPHNDADYSWAALRLVAAVPEQVADLDDLASDGATGLPGWSRLLDIDLAPAWALSWLAQLVGASCIDGLSVADQRMCIRDASGRRRGTVAAMRTAAQATLTGGRQVLITERYQGFAYRLRVQTYSAETPNSTVTRAAIVSQKPAGLVLTYDVLLGPTWDQATDTWDTSGSGSWDADVII
jgi:hypothetical protein